MLREFPISPPTLLPPAGEGRFLCRWRDWQGHGAAAPTELIAACRQLVLLTSDGRKTCAQQTPWIPHRQSNPRAQARAETGMMGRWRLRRPVVAKNSP